jgi:hypothetical protein
VITGSYVFPVIAAGAQKFPVIRMITGSFRPDHRKLLRRSPEVAALPPLHRFRDSEKKLNLIGGRGAASSAPKPGSLARAVERLASPAETLSTIKNAATRTGDARRWCS